MKNCFRNGAYVIIKVLLHGIILPALILLPCFVKAQSGDAEKFRQLLSREINQVKRVELLLKLSEAEYNARKAVEHAEKAINLADSLGLKSQKAHAIHKSGLAWKKLGDNLKSAERLIDARERFRSLGMKRSEYIVLRDLGETYRSAQGFEAAMTSFNQALSFFKLTADSVELAATWNRMAATTFEMLYLHPDFISINDSFNNEATPFLNIMSDYPELLSLYNNVISFLDSSEAIAQKLNLTDIIISNEIIKASFYNTLYKVEKSISQCDKIIAFMHTTGMTQDLPLIMINKARILGRYRLNQPEKAVELAKEALKIASENDIGVYIFMASQVLHDNYLAMGDYKIAYDYLIDILDLEKQFQYENMKLLVMTQQYEYRIKERELELKNRRFHIRIMIITIIFIIVGFSIFQIVLINKNKKLKRLLNELNNKTNIISQQNEELAIINSEKDRLISIVAHDLRNPFNSILGFSMIIYDDAHKIDVQETKRYAGIISSSAAQTLQLLENLLEWSNFQQGRMGFNPDVHRLQILVREAENLLVSRALIKGIKIINDIPEDITVFADHNMIFTILRNLIGNAVKFSTSGDLVTISAVAEAEGISISVADTGKGIREDDIEKLFRIDTGFTTPGTDNEKGSGFGLILCKEFIAKHKGTIWVESEEGKGSVFSFTLPVKSVSASQDTGG